MELVTDRFPAKCFYTLLIIRVQSSLPVFWKPVFFIIFHEICAIVVIGNKYFLGTIQIPFGIFGA